MNIVLVAIDTLSARHMSCYGYERNTTPFMDEYAKEGALFESCYCQAIPTQPSFTSVYTGQYAVTHGIVSHGGARGLDESAPFLPEILQRHGYTTCAVDNLYGHKKWLARGYEFYINPRLRGKYAQAIPCEQYNARARPWLRSHADEKFFLFVHYWDPHTPYLPPERYRHLFYDGDPCDPQNRSLEGLWRHPFGEPWKRWFDQLRPGITDAEYIVSMYDSEIRYVDDGVRELLGTLEELDIDDDTLVIIFGDHGEMMYRHGIYFDHHGLYDEDIHVPLIIRPPRASKKGLRIPHLVQHIDIAPTILDIAGIPIPDSMEGESLVPYLNGERDEPLYPFLVTEECTRMMKWGLRTDRYKYILAREQDYLRGPMQELYDLQSDPHEMKDVAEEYPDVARELEDTLEGWIAEMMGKNGLTKDPLVANGLTLGTHWVEWVKEHGYW
ncbi:MAG: sulfatase [Chloroflexota bacterium]|nr:sulfatase [Chloroflexota bacterium]